MMAVAAAQKNREMFAIKKSYSIEVSHNHTYDVVSCLEREKRKTVSFDHNINSRGVTCLSVLTFLPLTNLHVL